MRVHWVGSRLPAVQPSSASARARRFIFTAHHPAAMTVEVAPVDAAKGAPAAAPPAAPLANRKLRLLCLHGYLQNADVFRSRIGSMRKALKSRAEFVFLDAPYVAEPADAATLAENGGSADAPGRSWWQWSDLEPGTRPSRAAQYTGWAASQEAILAALEQHAPIDGLLGFSQGATATALFLAHAQLMQQQQQQGEGARQRAEAEEGRQLDQQQQGQQPDVNPEQRDRRLQLLRDLRFAVVVAGFLPRDAGYAATLQQGRPSLPCLHVHGAGDRLVPEERSRALWDCFDPDLLRIYQHQGAHMVPTCSGEFKQALVELLDDVKQGRQLAQQRQGLPGQQTAAGGGAHQPQPAVEAAVAAADS